MDAVLRALAVYLFLLVLFRVSGKRTLAEIDFRFRAPADHRRDDATGAARRGFLGDQRSC